MDYFTIFPLYQSHKSFSHFPTLMQPHRHNATSMQFVKTSRFAYSLPILPDNELCHYPRKHFSYLIAKIKSSGKMPRHFPVLFHFYRKHLLAFGRYTLNHCIYIMHARQYILSREHCRTFRITILPNGPSHFFCFF